MVTYTCTAGFGIGVQLQRRSSCLSKSYSSRYRFAIQSCKDYYMRVRLRFQGILMLLFDIMEAVTLLQRQASPCEYNFLSASVNLKTGKVHALWGISNLCKSRLGSIIGRNRLFNYKEMHLYIAPF